MAGDIVQVGTNVAIKVEGNKLTIMVDLSQSHGQTAKGFRRVASTGGNVTLPGGEKMGLNIYVK